MFVLLQPPIVVDLTPPSAETARITYTEVILSAVGVAGLIMILALLVGVTIGGVIVYRKKKRDATAPVGETSHVRLRI